MKAQVQKFLEQVSGRWPGDTEKLRNLSIIEEGKTKHYWMIGCALIGGAMVWCTHFLAMLGHNGHETMGLDLAFTVYSLVVAIVGVGTGFALAQYTPNKHRGGPVGGAIAGLGISAMHYTGMAAMTGAELVYDADFVTASVIFAVVFGAIGVYLLATADERRKSRSPSIRC